MLKNTLNLELSRDSGSKFVKHFLIRPGCARLSSTHTEDRRTRYDAFAEDVWQAMESRYKTASSRHFNSARRQYDPELDALPDSMLAGDDHVVSCNIVPSHVSIKSWLQEAKALGKSTMPTIATRNTPASMLSTQLPLEITPTTFSGPHSEAKLDKYAEFEPASRTDSSDSADMLTRLMTHPGRQYEKKKMSVDLPPSLDFPAQDHTLGALTTAATTAEIPLSFGAARYAL